MDDGEERSSGGDQGLLWFQHFLDMSNSPTLSETGKRKPFSRVELTLQQKVDKLNQFHGMAKKSQRDAAKELGISRGLLQNLLKNETKIRQAAKENGSVIRRRDGKDAEVEQALYNWWCFAKERSIPLNGRILCQKAESIAQMAGHDDFKATDGWFTRWKARNGISFSKSDVCAARAVRNKKETSSLSSDQDLLAVLKNYDPEDVFAVDETALFYKALPCSNIKGKNENSRVTVLISCTMKGCLQDLLVIGKSKCPAQVDFGKSVELPLDYEYSQDSLMNRIIWERWLHKLDVRMGKEGRKVVLLVNHRSYFTDSHALKNVAIKFLPENSSSLFQPCAQGIVRILKSHYRRSLYESVIDKIDDQEEQDISPSDVVRKFTLFEAMFLLREAWNQLNPSTIRNCWLKAGFSISGNIEKAADLFKNDFIDPPIGLAEEVFNRWVELENEESLSTEDTKFEDFERKLVANIMDNQKKDDNELSMFKDQMPSPSALEMRKAIRILEWGLHKTNFPSLDNFLKLNSSMKSHLRKVSPPKESTLQKVSWT